MRDCPRKTSTHPRGHRESTTVPPILRSCACDLRDLFCCCWLVHGIALSSSMELTRRWWRICAIVPVLWPAVVVVTTGHAGAVVSRRPVDCDFVCKVRMLDEGYQATAVDQGMKTCPEPSFIIRNAIDIVSSSF